MRDSITQWFAALGGGNEEAAKKLWDRYFHQLVDLGRGRLPANAAYDEEDLALSVFQAIDVAVREGRYGDVRDREELWQLLVTIALNKVRNRHRHAAAQKRNSDAYAAFSQEGNASALRQLPTELTGPEISVAMAEQCQWLLRLLDDRQLESVAVWKLDGYTNLEIAHKVQRSPRSVRRMLQLIRQTWERELVESS